MSYDYYYFGKAVLLFGTYGTKQESQSLTLRYLLQYLGEHLLLGFRVYFFQ